MITIEQKIECLKRWREIFPRLRKNLYSQSMMNAAFSEDENFGAAVLAAIIADYERGAVSEIARSYPWPQI